MNASKDAARRPAHGRTRAVLDGHAAASGLNSHNEWSRLREVVVGKGGSRACLEWPHPAPPKPGVLKRAREIGRRAFPPWLVQEIDDDHEGIVEALRGYGAKVLRPQADGVDAVFSTAHWTAQGDNVCNARDLYLIVGDTLVESPSQERHRYFEATAYYPLWYDYFRQGGLRWICGPKPLLKDGYLSEFQDAQGAPLLREDGGKFIRLNETEIMFEAANTVRMGRDLLYLVSRSGNNLGARWLQSVLGEEYRVHTTDKIYRSSHIDSTVMALGPETVLLNATRVNQENCPDVLRRKRRIWFDEIVPTPRRTVEFQERVRTRLSGALTRLGFKSNLGALSSDWIGMNFLSLDEQTVMVDERQVPLIKLLEKHGYDCVPVRHRHSYITGGIHCNTLDTVRDSKLED